MSDYEITIEGRATLKYDNRDGKRCEQRIDNETVVVPNLPRVISDGEIDMVIETTPHTVATYEMPADAFEETPSVSEE